MISAAIARALNPLATFRFYLTLELLRGLPYPAIFSFLTASGALSYRLHPRARRQAADWMRSVLPAGSPGSEVDRMVRRQFVCAAFRRYLGNILALRGSAAIENRIEIIGRHRIQDALDRGHGVVLISTHLGLPRLLACLLRSSHWETLYLFAMVYGSPNDRSLTARFRRWHRARFRVDSGTVLGDDDFSLTYMKKAYDHLRRNSIVNLAGDGRFGHHRLPVTILGRNLTLATGGISLGLLAGAPVLPCFTSITDGPRFHIEIQEPLSALPSLPRFQLTAGLLNDYAGRIENHIRHDPTGVVSQPFGRTIPT